jgi:hypothetical protein
MPSLVFQLVEFARNLTSLLTAHLAQPSTKRIQTSFPAASNTDETEDDWARRRREFDEDQVDADDNLGPGIVIDTSPASTLSLNTLTLPNGSGGVSPNTLALPTSGLTPYSALSPNTPSYALSPNMLSPYSLSPGGQAGTRSPALSLLSVPSPSRRYCLFTYLGLSGWRKRVVWGVERVVDGLGE